MKNHSFAKAPEANIQRSSFDRSHGLKTSFDADKLIPIYVDEVLPGDTHILNAQMFGRLATPIHPIMDNLYLDTFYFFVPMRLVWSNYYKFFGGQDDPDASIDYQIPTVLLNSGGDTAEGSLPDYFGLPTKTTQTVSNLPFRAYWLIYDEWFRDQNLQNSARISKLDTSAIISNTLDYTNILPATRGKRHDYFTSCLPWAQKGEAVSVPILDSAPVTFDSNVAGQVLTFKDTDGDDRNLTATTSQLQSGNVWTGTEVYADLTNATGATINAWRQAFQIQKFLERDARGGTRYTEKIFAHFGVTSPDSRLQRPEYLGGNSQSINVHPVAQTSSTDATTPQGNLSGFGTTTHSSGFSKSFTEHGFIIGLANIRADLTYQQGIDKMWTRSTQYDFYFPSFAHLGEQAVLNKEIYANGTATDDQVFGYQERYAEYRYKRSTLTGLFRSNASASLDAWHLSQEFSTLPTLGDTFIKSNTPLDRAIAVPSEPHMILDCYFNLKSIRPMPVFAPPGLIDHF